MLLKPTVSFTEPKPEVTHFQKAIPDHVLPPHGNRSRRLSVFTPPSDRSEEGRFKQLDPVSRQRRFSEPQGPKMEALRKLSNVHSKIFQTENIADAMSNFPKVILFSCSLHKSAITWIFFSSVVLNHSTSSNGRFQERIQIVSVCTCKQGKVI